MRTENLRPLRQRAGRPAAALAALLLALSTSGCVDRTLVVRSEPPGALVAVNGEEAGVAPVTLHFDTYGVFEVVLSADRHARLRTTVPVHAPWYEKIPLDFFSETLWPGMIRDTHEVTLTLAPLPAGDETGLDQRERQLRDRAEPAAPPAPTEGS